MRVYGDGLARCVDGQKANKNNQKCNGGRKRCSLKQAAVYQVKCSYLGKAYLNKKSICKPVIAPVLALLLLPGGMAYSNPQVEEILVKGHQDDSDKTVIRADAESLLSTAGAVGDPMRAALALPGVSFGGDDLDAPVVRGAGPDDNVFYVDDMPIPFMFHMLGDSVLSNTVLRTFDVHKSAQTTKYSNVAGGIFDIGLRDPKTGEWSGGVDLSQLKSGFLVEGGVGEHAAWLSYRYNTMHLFLTEYEENDGPTIDKMPEGDDYAARYMWSGEKNKISLTVIGANDHQEAEMNKEVPSPIPLDEKEKRMFNTLGIRWERELGLDGVLSSTLSSTTSKDDLSYYGVWGFFENMHENRTHLRSHYKQQFGRHGLEIGLNIDDVQSEYSQLSWDARCDDFNHVCDYSGGVTRSKNKKSFGHQAVYINDHWQLNDSWAVEAGIHYAQDDYLSESYPEARLGFTYKHNGNQLYSRFGNYHQQLPKRDLLTLEGSESLKSEKSSQFALGYVWDLSGRWTLHSELYHKTLSDLLLINESQTSNDLAGTVSGAEVMLAKSVGDAWYGWLAISYADSTRTNEKTKEKVKYRYDTPLSTNLVVNYRFGSGWMFGMNYTFQSGAHYTPTSDLRLTGIDPQSPFSYTTDYGEINSKQLDSYQRLDVRLQKTRNYKFGEVLYYVDVLNALGTINYSERTYDVAIVDGSGKIVEDNVEGVPQFIALGATLKF